MQAPENNVYALEQGNNDQDVHQPYFNLWHDLLLPKPLTPAETTSGILRQRRDTTEPFLLHAVYPNLPPEKMLPNDVTVLATIRCGIPGESEKTEWLLAAKPPRPITTGCNVSLWEPRGPYHGFSRTVGGVVGSDRNWVTFLLQSRANTLDSKTVHTLGVPIANSGHWAVRIVRRIIRIFFGWLLADEHPYNILPLPSPQDMQ